MSVGGILENARGEDVALDDLTVEETRTFLNAV